MILKIKLAGLIFFAVLTINSNSWAANYSTMSTAELSKLRSTMQTASQADRDAFHAEWLRRVELMTPAERQEYMGQGKGMVTNGSSGHAAGNMGNGNGSGGGSGGGNNSGMSSGSGNGMGGNSGRGAGGSSGGMGNGNGGGMGMGN